MIEYKPCKFCGGTDVFVMKDIYGDYFVYCSDCKAQGPLHSNRYEAAEAWNVSYNAATLNEIDVEMQRGIYYHGEKGAKYGIWDTAHNTWRFDICEDTPMLAMARLHQRIGYVARRSCYEARRLPKIKRKMEVPKVIEQLKSLRKNSESFIQPDEPNSIWNNDVLALDVAIEMLETM